MGMYGHSRNFSWTLWAYLCRVYYLYCAYSFTMTTTNVERLVEEVLDLAKLTDAYERNGLMGVQELARSALSQARQEAGLEAYNAISGLHVKARSAYPSNTWDAGYHDALFDAAKAVANLSALTTEGK